MRGDRGIEAMLQFSETVIPGVIYFIHWVAIYNFALSIS